MAKNNRAKKPRKQSPEQPAPNSERRRFSSHRVRLVLVASVIGFIVWQKGNWWPPPFHQQARTSLRSHDPVAAHEWLDIAEWAADDHPETAFLRARSYRKQGDLERVRDWLGKAYERGIPRERVQREQWLALAQSGQLARAEAQLPGLLADPGAELEEVCEAYVLGYIRAHRLVDALRLLDTWIADFPDSPHPRMLRGQIYSELSRFKDAEADFRRALSAHPDHSEAALGLADVLRELKRPQESLEFYEICSKDDRLQLSGELGRALALKALGDAEQAGRIIRGLVEDHPDSDEALLELGRLELDAGRYEPAVKLLLKTYELVPQDIEARYLLARALHDAERRDEANEHFEWVARAREASAEIQKLKDVVRKEPTNVEKRYATAQLLMKYGARDEAVMWMLSVIDLAPDHRRAHEALAAYYEALAATDPQYRKLADEHRRKAGAAAKEKTLD